MLAGIMNLPHLKHLLSYAEVGNCKVVDRLAMLPQHATGLKTLELHRCEWSRRCANEDWVVCLGELESLTRLKLSLHLWDVEAISRAVLTLPSLQELDLSENSFTEFSCNRLLKRLSARDGFGPIQMLDLRECFQKRFLVPRDAFKKAWPGLFKDFHMVYTKEGYLAA